MLHGEHSAILSNFIKLPFVIKIFVLSIFEWLFFTGFTVLLSSDYSKSIINLTLLASEGHNSTLKSFGHPLQVLLTFYNYLPLSL